MFFEFFPPPQFLRMRAAGVHVTDSTIRGLVFKEHGRTNTVAAFAEIPLERGLIERGVVKDNKKFIQILTALREKLGVQYVHISLPEEQTYLYRTHVPEGKVSEMHTVIESTIQENVPLSVDEAIFDFAATEYAQNGQVQVSVVVAPRKIVDTYVSLFTAAGFIVISLNAESQAIAQALTDATDRSNMLIVSFGHTKTVFALTRAGVVQFSSSVTVDGGSLTSLIEKYFNLDRATAHTKKHQLISGQEPIPDELQLTVMASLSVIKDELDKLLNYWRSYGQTGQGGQGGQAQPVDAQLKGMVLVGDDALFPGISDALSAHAKIPAAVGNVWATAALGRKYVPAVSRADSLNFAATIGLAQESLLIHRHV